MRLYLSETLAALLPTEEQIRAVLAEMSIDPETGEQIGRPTDTPEA